MFAEDMLEEVYWAWVVLVHKIVPCE